MQDREYDINSIKVVDPEELFDDDVRREEFFSNDVNRRRNGYSEQRNTDESSIWDNNINNRKTTEQGNFNSTWEQQTTQQSSTANIQNQNTNVIDDSSQTTNNKKTEQSKSNKKSKGKKKKKQKKIKSYIGRVLSHKDTTKAPILAIEFLFAFVLDILRIIKNLVLTILIIGIIGAVAGAIFVWVKIEPTYTEYKEFADNIVENSTAADFKLSESSYIYDSDGNILAKLKASQDSQYLDYNDIPTDVVNAFIAVEDQTFWDNPGFDVKGIVRVLYNYVKSSGDEQHGASTITQQLVKNIYLTSEVSIERKAKELMIAYGLTNKYTKKEIMEFYVNDICFANAYYGIQAASKGYFNKDVNGLSLSQMAYLCAIPNSPEYYNPYKYPERALDRRDKILGDMLELGYITQKEYDTAVAEEIVIESPTYEFNDYMTTYAIDCAVRYLMEQNGFEFRYKFDDMDDYNDYYSDYNTAYSSAKDNLYTGGYKVYTSLDPTVQANLQAILDEQLSFNDELDASTGIYALQGAITAYDNSTGKIIAVVGGRSQEDTIKTYSLNRAYQSYRQPGSTIKPLVVYTPALMNGYNADTTVHNIDVSKAKEKGVDVQSLSGTSMTLRKALEQSKNGVAWQIFDKFGPTYCLSFLNEMKFSEICPDDYYDSAALGGLTYGVTTVEMAAAYATLENHGTYREATCLVSLIDKDGNETYQVADEKQVYEAEAADNMVDLMEGVLTNGTAKRLNWYDETKMVAAGKTGTTNNSKDGWFCGFTTYYTVSVWVGFDTPRELDNLSGASYPGQIWKASMLSLIEDKEVITEFEQADYSLYGDDDDDDYDFSVSDDLPSYAYDLYLYGRDDSEVLSSGYIVYDYRKDRVIGESVDEVISDMYNLDKSSSSYSDNLQSLYLKGCTIVDSIYSTKYTKEKQSELDSAYKECK
jgi:membrane peptidoglycan carboxypeptidase